MADEAHEEPEEVAEAETEATESTEAPVSAPTTFWSRNWPLPAFVAGSAMLATALFLWQGPLRQGQRDQYLEDLAYARILADENPYAAREVLGGLLGRRWRVPESQGELYYLLGHVNQQLAHAAENDSDTTIQYERAARQALIEADRVGVPERIKLAVAESLGTSLVNGLDHTQLTKAMGSLMDALHRRDLLNWVLLRRQLQAELAREEPNADTIESLREQWLVAPNVDHRYSDMAEATADLTLDELDAELDSIDPIEGLFSYPVSQQADDEMRTLLGLGLVNETIEQAETQRETNDLARSRILDALARASMKLTPPAYDDAERWATTRLSLPLPDHEKAQARLQRAEILLATNQPERARDELDRVVGDPAQRRQANYLLGQSLLDAARQIRRTTLVDWLKQYPALPTLTDQVVPLAARLGLEDSARRLFDVTALKKVREHAAYRRVLDCLGEIIADKDADDEMKADSLLWMGVALTGLDRYAEAEEYFQEVLRNAGSDVLDQATRFYQADAFGQSARAAEAIATFREAVAQTAVPQRYANPYLSARDLREIFLANWERFQTTDSDYVSAIAIAQIFKDFPIPGVEPGEADHLLARSSHSLGRQLEREMHETDDLDRRMQLAEESRSRFRDAGRAYREVSRAQEGSDEYPSLLWESATNLFDGGAFDQAIPVLHRFIVAHVGGPRDFPAKILLARAHMALRDFAEARNVLETALRESSSAVDRFRGRILLSECYLEIRRHLPDTDDDSLKARAALLDLSEQLLDRNLSGENQELTPYAVEWQDSLFAKGRLLAESERYADAIRTFAEFARRYPEDPRTLEAQFLIADSHLRRANNLESELKDENLAERDRVKKREEQSEQLTRALEAYRTLADQLLDRIPSSKMTRHDQNLLATSLFGQARVLTLQGNWEEAIGHYEDAAYRFLDRPECLTAYIEMATCYQLLGRDADAESAIRQALWILGQIDDQAFVESNRDRQVIKKQLEVLLGRP